MFFKMYFYNMILVTGATGLVGSQLLLELAKKEKTIKVLKRKSANLSLIEKTFCNDKELLSNIQWVEGDVLNMYELFEAMGGITQVYHCAAVVSFYPGEKAQIMNVNVKGTANVVNMALEAGVQKLCYVSSVAALGRSSSSNIITEEVVWKNSADNSVYALSKYQAEREVWRGIAEGLDAVIVNPSIILGAGDWSKSSTSIFKAVWEGVRYYTKGVNGFVDVRDVVKAMILLMESEIKNKRFIISSENIGYKDLLDEIANNFKKPLPNIYISSSLSEFIWRVERFRNLLTGSRPLITKETARTANKKYYYSGEKVRKTLGFEFIPIKKSVRDACESFLKELNKANN